MEPLKSQFKGRGEVKGFTFHCVDRKPGTAYLYKVYIGDCDHADHFEVFKHSENSFLKRVAYPGSNSFGSWAWSFKDERSARAKFNQLG